MQMIEDKKVFQKVYPFTTENVGAYFERIPFKDKKVFTVGSSLDQAFNALLLGAKEVTVFDMNENVEKFYNLKKKLIENTPRNVLYEKVLNQKEVPITTDVFSKESTIKINHYLKDDKSYKKLRSILREAKVNFVTGDIFNMQEAMPKEKFDIMILSNILQYLDYFSAKEEPYTFLKKNFDIWKTYLNDYGLLQLIYLYSYNAKDLYNQFLGLSIYDLRKVQQALKGNELMIEWFNDSFQNAEDAIVTYTKKR